MESESSERVDACYPGACKRTPDWSSAPIADEVEAVARYRGWILGRQ